MAGREVTKRTGMSWVRYRRWRYWRVVPGAIAAAAVTILGYVTWDELQTSRRQADYFAKRATQMWFWTAPGASPAVEFPKAGPYNERLGYVELPELVERLTKQRYTVHTQARQSPELRDFVERGFSPPYREKTRAGLRILDCRREPLYDTRHPQQEFTSLDAVPPVVAQSLLYIENRRLLDPSQPMRNPAVEWPRLASAVLAQGRRLVDSDHNAPGGSTLATQMEKYRHSPDGITTSMREKFRQMYSASLRAYAKGPDTSEARREILLDYLNTLPLAAAVGYGEVSGLADGLWAYYGLRMGEIDRLLRLAPGEAGYGSAEHGRAYRAALSLVIAQRRPSDLLGPGRAGLAALTDSYLRLLATAGVITPTLRDAALGTTVEFIAAAEPPRAENVSEQAAYAVRRRVLDLLERRLFYDIDRLDLTVVSTFNTALQSRITERLERLGDPDRVAAGELDAPRMIGRNDPSRIIYSFTLYERGPNANFVRVQTDTDGQPFDINAGARIELGSTAKLRTLASYLDLVARLHERYAALDPAVLARLQIDRRDRLTRWVVDHLRRTGVRDLDALMEAALERRYSASPAERFFTAGGVHRFSNYSSRDNGRVPTLREAFRGSINLPFIRLMRDIADHHMYGGDSHAGAMLDDRDHPARELWLERFADYEGTIYLRRFYSRYAGLGPAEALEELGERTRDIAARVAVVFRSVRPDAGIDEFREFLERHLARRLSDDAVADLYTRYAVDRYNLHDRGYISSRHPLELWLVAYLTRHPGASFDEVVHASREERQAVYEWLDKRSQSSQNTRIRILLEIDAFEKIHAQWTRVGYPYGSLVASYATSIGVSGDNPAALAELIGVILSGGVRHPTVRVKALHFGEGTPYETRLEHTGGAERVMHPAVARALEGAMADVVEDGTAKRLSEAYVDAQGNALRIGGKTGTGDNRRKQYGDGGRFMGSRSVSRTATFAFFLGERYFGVITAYVPAPWSNRFRFTSALPVQIVKNLLPDLMPRLEQSPCTGSTVTQQTAQRVTTAAN